MDFSDILNGLSTSTAVSSMIAAAALIAVLGFAMWCAKAVASFFEDGEEELPEGWQDDEEHVCRRCGNNYCPDPEYRICAECER